MSKRQKAQQCELCNRAFSFTLVQHQCKRCNRAVCAYCGEHKGMVVNYDLKVKHRVCSICRDEQELIQTLIQKEQLKVNKNSLTTTRWLKYISSALNDQELTEAYLQVLEDSKQNLNEKQQEQVREVSFMVYNVHIFHIKFRSNMNYSLFEFDYYLTKDLPPNVINSLVTSVLQCVVFRNPKLILTQVLKLNNQNLVNLTTFLLYYHSQPIVFSLMTYLAEQIIPQRFLEEQSTSEITATVEFLEQIGAKNLLMDLNDLPHLKKFCNSYSQEMLSGLFICHLNFSCLNFLFDHLFKIQDFYELEKTMALVTKIHMSDIKLFGQNKDQIYQQILKNTTPLQLKEYLCKEDRVKVQSKRDIHSKSDDLFQQFSERVSQQSDVKMFVQLLEDCVIKTQPLNPAQKQMINNLPIKHQQVMYEIIGMRQHKLSLVKEEEQVEIDQNDDTKGETYSQTSSADYHQVNLLKEEILKLKQQIQESQEQRAKDRKELEQVLYQQENIANQIQTQLHQQENFMKKSDFFSEINDSFGKQLHIYTNDSYMQTEPIINNDQERISALEQQLEDQRIAYEAKLQQIAEKQTRAITKILNDCYNKPEKEAAQSPIIKIIPSSKELNEPKIIVSQQVINQQESSIRVKSSSTSNIIMSNNLSSITKQQQQQQQQEPAKKDCMIF